MSFIDRKVRMKIFRKLKKMISVATSVLMIVGVLTPTYALGAQTSDTVTVNPTITNDQTPGLSGTMSNVTDSINVTLSGTIYVAENNGDGTWVLEDNIVSILSEGVYDVTAVTSSGITDTATNELTVDVTSPNLTETRPVPEYTNLVSPRYGFSSDEAGSIEYDGLCRVGNLLNARIGENSVVFGPYSKEDEGLYDDCEVTVTDLAGNSSVLKVTPFTIDMTAPVVMTYAEYFNQTQAGTQPILAQANPELLNDSGVYVQEVNNSVTITTKWELVTPTTEGSVRTYNVTYKVTDLAGNVTVSTPVMVELTTDEFDEAVGNLPVTLLGESPVIHERGTIYEDQGAVVEGWLSSVVHVWTTGNLDTAKVGNYTLGYMASETMPANVEEINPMAVEYEVRDIEVLDTVGPGSVTGLVATSCNGYVQLTWVNPVSDDLAGLDIYRSTVVGERGVKVAAALSPETTSFDDYTVVNGTTYYYTVVAFDGFGNNGLGSIQVTARPSAPKVAVATETYYDSGITEIAEAQEVKSDETQNETDTDEESNVPVIGIIILILLILLGIYLLYLQNPSWFTWMMFWKRETPKSNKKK
jgi:hypothetical protein